jgi:VWFA-related protein
MCAQDRVAITPRARPESALAATRANLRLDVRMVQIPVTVTDLRGAPVLGLPAANFRVFDNDAPRPIAALSVSEAPISAGIVFDTSRSMKPRLGLSRAALDQFLRTSATEDEFFLVRFSDKPEMLASFTRSPADILEPLALIEARGWTALNDAICLAANIVGRGRHARRVLLVLTDGNDNNSRYSDAELLSLLREADVQVYAINLIERSRFLQRICEETGGRAIFVHRMAELASAMEDLSRQIRSEYLISYNPAEGRNDGRYHRVRVEVDPPAGSGKVYATWRRGYFD